MHLAIDAHELGDDARDDVLVAAERELSARAGASVFDGARDVRLRLRRAGGALLCVVTVGFASGALVTSTATGERPLDAVVGALDDLPHRADLLHRSQSAAPPTHGAAPAHGTDRHAAVRQTLQRLLREA